jgi:hypothetical protein
VVVGTLRCGVPARVQRAELPPTCDYHGLAVAPLNAARTSQRDVPTTFGQNEFLPSVQQLAYFQCLDLPSASQAIAVVSREFRVSARFAPVIHSRYSRLWLGLKFSNVASAVLFFVKAAMKSAGTASGFFALGLRAGDFTPASLRTAAFRM